VAGESGDNTVSLPGPAEIMKTAAAMPLHMLLIVVIAGFAYVSYLDTVVQKETSRSLVAEMIKHQDALQKRVQDVSDKAFDNLQALTDSHNKQLAVMIEHCGGKTVGASGWDKQQGYGPRVVK
jgi:hypothetical protein